MKLPDEFQNMCERARGYDETDNIFFISPETGGQSQFCRVRDIAALGDLVLADAKLNAAKAIVAARLVEALELTRNYRA